MTCEVVTDQKRIKAACAGGWGTTLALVAGPRYGLNLWGPRERPQEWRVEMLARQERPSPSPEPHYFGKLSSYSYVELFKNNGAAEMKLLFSLAEEWARVAAAEVPRV